MSSRGIKPGRVYVGNLPPDIRKKEVEDLFNQYGRIVNCDFKKTISGTPFAFIEYDDERDAEEAIRARDGFKLDGHRLRVEVPFSGRTGGPRRKNGPPQRAAYRVIVSNLPPSGSWQDLKDHLRDAGPCVYAEVFRDGTGIMEFASRDYMNSAIRIFNGSKFRSHEGEVSRIDVRAASPPHRDRSPSSDYDRRYRRSSSGCPRRRDSYSRSRSRSSRRSSTSRSRSRSQSRSQSRSRSRSVGTDSKSRSRSGSRSRSRSGCR